MSMFNKGKEVVPMPKKVDVPVAAMIRTEPGPIPFAPQAQETDFDAETNLLNAHRRIKAELAESRRLCNDAMIELKVRNKIIDELEAKLVDYEQCKKDCAHLESTFQSLAAILDGFLMPKALKREEAPVDLPKFEEAIAAVEDERHGD